ncbi:MAG: MucBP domain-containing protein [Clostridia bacterium]|nr:MucBP domain-containing protein [Clostridia bacterium]
MIKNILKNKLKSIGYTEEIIDRHLDEVDYNLLSTNENFSENDVEVVTYHMPDVDMERAFLNIDDKYIQRTLIDGETELKTVELPTGSRMTFIDYALDKNLCMVLITNDLKLEIVFYEPDSSTKMKYSGHKYDTAYSKDREAIMQDYLTEFTSGGRLLSSKANEVLNMLANDFVIDEMIIKNIIPVLRLYNSPENFAEKITSYEFKYINRRLNRIEIAEKSALIKRTSKNVKTGYISNDPYLKLNEVNNYPDFYLNVVSYFWLFSNEKGVEEIGIYTAPKAENVLYSATVNTNSVEFSNAVREICTQFENQLGSPVSEEAIRDVLCKLNYQLIVPPVDLILKYAENSTDPIEPLSYRYKAIVDPAEFEERLYNSIEDNIGRRYKYKLTENVFEDLTTIGNKLDYTSSDGKTVKKQSVADFNENGNAVIIRRETLIDENNIPALLGYIYEDIEDKGTANLPVPSIEVDFYFPSPNIMLDGVRMYNGTNYENASGAFLTGNRFYDIDEMQSTAYKSGPILDGSTRVTVRYIASNSTVLKENVINNVFPGDVYRPEILPVISDKDGKEWTCELTNVPSLRLSDNEESNKIELQYVEKMADVKLSFINTEGKELARAKTLSMQVGTEINMNDYLTVTDNEGVEWDFEYARPNKLVIGEDSQNNRITFVYDVTRVSVLINFVNKAGTKLKEPMTVKAIADRRYTAKIEPIIEDENGRAWVYISEAAASITPVENEENVINLVYDEMKTGVVTSFVDEDGNKIIDDLVEFIQVGKQYSAKYEERVHDMQGRLWQYASSATQLLKVKPDKNEIKVVYHPVYSKVTAKIVNENGRSIVRDIVEDVQVGSTYTVKDLGTIKDVNGRLWQSKDQKSIEISEDEKQNVMSLTFEPLLVNVVVKYLDDESKEITAQKTTLLQAGEIYTPDMPLKLDDKEGKRWKLLASNEKQYTVNEREEDNKISIYYEKDLTSVKLSFKDMYSNTLLDDVTVEWQIGDKYSPKAYDRIKDKNNARWSFESSEPKTMVVKEKNNHFILIYGEIRTKVIIRFVNIVDNTAIKEPEIVTAKLGASYIPNIQHEMIDTNRLNWTYVGEKEISITTQEEEQDNIITLKYEPHNAEVVVKYLDATGRSIVDDSVKAMQIGREVQIKRIEKVYSADKLGYALKNMSNTVVRVTEDVSKNTVICEYVPLLGKVMVVYRNGDGLDLIKPLNKELQVGSKFKAEIIDKVIDNSGKHWNYAGEEDVSIIVPEEDKTVELHYEPALKKVRVQFLDATGIEIDKATEELIQVGEVYVPHMEEKLLDSEGKSWKYVSCDKKEIVVSEDETQNDIIVKYDKELVDVNINFVNGDGKTVRASENIKAQLGDVLKYQAPETVIDRDGLGWELSAPDHEFKIANTTNQFTISYVPYLVNVYDKFVNENDEEIAESVVSKQQVGTKYEPTIKEFLLDSEAREWLHVDSKLFGKSTAIKVSADETVNNAIIKYKPSLADVTILYVDPLGMNIKSKTVEKAQIGSEFSANIIERITDNKGNKWTYNPNTKNQVKVQKEGTVLTLSYEEQKAIVIFKYQDEFGNRLKAPKKSLAQVGMSFIPEPDSVIEDDQGRVWEYKERDLESIEIKDTEQDNVFVMTYIPLRVDVTVFIRNNRGEEIAPAMTLKAPLGAMYTPNVDNTITDENSLMFKLVKMEPEALRIKETPIGAKNVNVFNLTYEPVYSTVTIKYQDIDGNSLRDDEKQQLQVGTKFTPKMIQYIKDRRDNQWELVTSEEVSLRVMENVKENVVKFVYEIAKADVIIRYKDTEGNSIKEEDKFNIQIGKEFVPNAPGTLLDSANRKWSFFSCEPVKLRVGSINNVVTVLYQEEKATVLVKYRDETGKQLKGDDRVLVQIGTIFKPKVSSKVIYDENEIWRFSHFEPGEITVSENASENVISQIYTNKQGGAAASIEESTEEMTHHISEAETKVEPEVAIEQSVETTEVVPEVEETKGYVYQNTKLKKLDNVTLLNDNEKAAIEKINILNNDIIKKLRENPNGGSTVLSETATFIDQEKEIVNNNLGNIILNDKTGSRLLKVFEIATEPVESDKLFDTMQQRKAVLMTDYFMNNALSDGEQAMYICSKGKNDQQIELIRAAKGNATEINEAWLQIAYEKLMLENYYRARSAVKDSYFTDEASKAQLSEEINVALSNMLVNQTYNLVIKDNLNLYQETELRALYRLLNPMQKNKLMEKVNKIADGRQRKAVTKKIGTL